jgi:oligoribonuclease
MAKKRNNLVWLDCEMTGLDPEVNVILEIAAIVTDSDLNVVAESPGIAVFQEESVLESMDKWNATHHAASELLDRVRERGVSVEEAEQQMLAFLGKHCNEGESPLCGNSIGHDRRFLAKYMPALHAFFHYQSIDVSSLKQLVSRWFPAEFHAPAGKDAHRALPDIRESIEELKHYREKVFVSLADPEKKE